MATPKQKEFVADIESGVSALIMEECKVKQVYQVLDRAGYKTADLAPYLHRLRMGEEWEMIERLSAAFLRVGLSPVCIAKALEHSPKSKAVPKLADLDSEGFKLENELPMAEIGEAQSPVNPSPTFGHWTDKTVPAVKSATTAFSQVQSILDTLTPNLQKKVIGAAMAWYEVGG